MRLLWFKPALAILPLLLPAVLCTAKSAEDYHFQIWFSPVVVFTDFQGEVFQQERNNTLFVYYDNGITTETKSAATGLDSSLFNFGIEVRNGRWGCRFNLTTIAINEHVQVGDNIRYEKIRYEGKMLDALVFNAGPAWYFYDTYDEASEVLYEFYTACTAGILSGTMNPYAWFINLNDGQYPYTVSVTGFNISPSLGADLIYYNLLMGLSLTYQYQILYSSVPLDFAYDHVNSRFNEWHASLDLRFGLIF